MYRYVLYFIFLDTIFKLNKYLDKVEFKNLIRFKLKLNLF